MQVHRRRASARVALTQTLDQPHQRSSPETDTWRRGAVSALSPLWVGGAALLCLLLAVVLKAPLTGVLERADVWAQYLVLGTVFPLVVAAVVLLERSGRTFPAIPG